MRARTSGNRLAWVASCAAPLVAICCAVASTPDGPRPAAGESAERNAGERDAADTTYYVSPQGDDTTLGTDQNRPWKTLSRASSHQYLPGDRLLLQRGGYWSGQCLTMASSGTAGRPIVISAYDEGDLPVIGGAQLVAGAAAWKQEPGIGPKIWSTRISSKGPPRQVYVEGKHSHDFFNVRYDFQANVQKSPEDLSRPSTWAVKDGALYLYCDRNPGDAHRRIEVQVLYCSLRISGSHVHVSDLIITKAKNGIEVSGNDNVLTRVTSTMNAQNGISVAGRATRNRFIECVSTNNGSFKYVGTEGMNRRGKEETFWTQIGHAIKFQGKSQGNLVIRCKLNGSAEDAVQTQTGKAKTLETANVIEDCEMLMSRENAVDQKAGALIFRRCTMTLDPGPDGLTRHEVIAFKKNQPVLLEDNRIFASPGSSSCSAVHGPVVTSRRNLYVFPTREDHPKHAGMGWKLWGPGDGTLFENDVMVGSGNSLLSVKTGRKITIRNCTLVASMGRPVFEISSGKRNLTLEGNIIQSVDRPPLRIVKGDVVLRHNLYYRTDGKTQFIVDKSRKGRPAADIRTLDAAAVVGDPMFVDPAKLDFRLRAGSPAVGLGHTGKGR